MGTAKLMTPLFYDGNYNVEKKRMRAVLERCRVVPPLA